jgi:hypothetical protein
MLKNEQVRWLPEEESYLKELSRLCQELSNKYKLYYELYKTRQARFRIPSIIISSVTGLLSFGSTNFTPTSREYVSITVGIASLCIALLNSIETYMKIAENMAGSAQACIELQKLKESIDMELSLPLDDRPTQGILFLRDCYTRYERILDIAPNIFKTIRFIKPSYNDSRKKNSITIAPYYHNSDDIENDTQEVYAPKTVNIQEPIQDKEDQDERTSIKSIKMPYIKKHPP